MASTARGVPSARDAKTRGTHKKLRKTFPLPRLRVMVWTGVTKTASQSRKNADLASWMFDSWKLSAVLSFACLSAAHARAQTIAKQFVHLKYDIDPALQDCPTAFEFRSIVAQELGYDPYLAGSSVGLLIRVRSTDTGIEGVIDWGSAAKKKSGERRFAAHTEDCRAMMTTVGFVVAVQIQLTASEHAAEPIPQSTHTETDTDSGPPPSPGPAHNDGSEHAAVALTLRRFELRPPPLPSRTRWITRVGAGPAVGVGLGPGAIGLGRFFGAVQHRWVGFELGAETSLASTTRQAYGGGFRHQLTLGSLAACAWQGSISACALTRLGRIQVEGVGVDVPASPKGLVAEAGPRVAYSLGLDQHLALLGHVDALCSLTSWTVYVNHVAVWTMPRFAAVAGINVVARF